VAKKSGKGGKSGGRRPGDEFFSYADTDGEVSLVLTRKSYAALQAYRKKRRLGTGGVADDVWRAIRVNGDWGFEEFGLVSVISNQLRAVSVDIVYLSTFARDYVLVPADALEKAERCLKANLEFTVVSSEST
jgi:hypothetical protein